MKRGALAMAALFAGSSGACALLVGVGDHHLRDDADGGGDGSSAVDAAPSDDAPDVDAGTDAGDTLPEAGVAHLTVLASGLHQPTDLVGDNVALYFLTAAGDGQSGAVMRLDPKADAGAEVIAPAVANPIALRLDLFVNSNALLFTDDGAPAALDKVQRDGGPVTQYDSDAFGFHALAALNYAVTEGIEPLTGLAHLRRTVISGAPDPVDTCFLYSSSAPTTFPAILMEDLYVFFEDSAAGAIMRMTKGCGDPPVVFAAGQQAVAMTNDSNTLYWATADGYVRALAKETPGGAITTYGGGLAKPGALVTRNASVFVTDEGAGLVLWLTPSFSRILVANGQGGPHGIHTPDGSAIFWTNRTSGEIVRGDL